MSRDLIHVLLVFDHDVGHLIDEQEFTDPDAALDAYVRREREARGKTAIEIVLISSDSRDTIRETHASYYDGSVWVKRYLDTLARG